MFTKTAIALALVLSTVSGALAATKQRSTNPAWNVYDNGGAYIGSDPDGNVRHMLQFDRGSE